MIRPLQRAGAESKERRQGINQFLLKKGSGHEIIGQSLVRKLDCLLPEMAWSKLSILRSRT
jgi:hypothetical protein